MSGLRHVLIVAGLDPSGGAGILADARVVAEHGARPVGVVTGLTEQDTTGVRAANVVSAEVVAAQLRSLLSDIEVAAVKIGMLGSDAIAAAVSEGLALTGAPVVWDPVLLPTRGRVPLYEGDPARAMQLIAPHTAVITPNLSEAAALSGAQVGDVAGMRVAAAALRASGVEAALVTGGHLAGGQVVDVLAHPGGTLELAAARVGDGADVHGTGCALSSALAARLALGDELEAAFAAAKQYVTRKLEAAFAPGRGLRALV